MQKISITQTSRKNIFKGQLTIGLDLGDRSSAYCVLNDAGEIVLLPPPNKEPEADAPEPLPGEPPKIWGATNRLLN